MRALFVVVALSFSAVADVHTWICQKQDGSKSVQDRPCEGTVQLREFDAVSQPPQTFDQWAQRYNAKIWNDYDERQCQMKLATARGAEYREALSRCRGQQ